MSDRAAIAIVADDDEFFRLALVALLMRHLGFTNVVETASLDASLERLGDERDCRLAIFDLSMPGMESPASLGAVRECAPGVKVVVVSASVERSDILGALEAGAHGYVPKRLGAAELCRALELVLSGSIYVPPSLADVSKTTADATGVDATTADSPPAGSSGSHGERDRLVRRTPLGSLTPRQREVLDLVVQGKSNKEIARALALSEGTAKIHVAALLRALNVSNRAAAAVAGARLLDAASA